MVNFTDSLSCIPQEACNFYRGYYEMSGDMGSLIIKLGLLFASLDIIHWFLKFLCETYLFPKLNFLWKKTKV